MNGIKGTWYSITWKPRNYSDSRSLYELKNCPAFIFIELGDSASKSTIEQGFEHVYIDEMFKTEIFVKDSSGEQLPTHYRQDGLQPKESASYDNWLIEYHKTCQNEIDRIKTKQQLFLKNAYLEYASQIIRHDMHSGINTYLPRGLASLKKRLTDDIIKEHKLQMGMKLLENGLKHTQNVYKGVYAFTNLVREKSVLEKKEINLQQAMTDYLMLTSYHPQVELIDLPTLTINESLFCTALDNLIRNGLRYNDSADKLVKVYYSENVITVEDNGRGISQEEFDYYCEPYRRNTNQKEKGTGLGLNIVLAILTEHDCFMSVEKMEKGTKIRIKIL